MQSNRNTPRTFSASEWLGYLSIHHDYLFGIYRSFWYRASRSQASGLHCGHRGMSRLPDGVDPDVRVHVEDPWEQKPFLVAGVFSRKRVEEGLTYLCSKQDMRLGRTPGDWVLFGHHSDLTSVMSMWYQLGTYSSSYRWLLSNSSLSYYWWDKVFVLVIMRSHQTLCLDQWLSWPDIVSVACTGVNSGGLKVRASLHIQSEDLQHSRAKYKSGILV